MTTLLTTVMYIGRINPLLIKRLLTFLPSHHAKIENYRVPSSNAEEKVLERLNRFNVFQNHACLLLTIGAQVGLESPEISGAQILRPS